MQRKRILLQIRVELDPLPGGFHTETEAAEAIAEILNNRIPHYHPVVIIPE